LNSGLWRLQAEDVMALENEHKPLKRWWVRQVLLNINSKADC
jgi:hypothetical protein